MIQWYNISEGGVSELADERDLGSRGAIRVGSSPTFPMKHWVSGCSSAGRTSPCQGEGRGFESHRPLFSVYGARKSLVVLREFSRLWVFLL